MKRSIPALLLLVLASCAPVTKKLELSLPPGLEALADRGRLPSLPRAWIYEEGPGADCALVLTWEPAADPGPGTVPGIVLAHRWLAPALSMADPRFNLSLTEAGNLEMRELSTIKPPLRVPCVEGQFPGDRAWPFEENLVGRLKAGTGRPPRILARWWEKNAPSLKGAFPEIFDPARAGEERPWRLGAVGDIQFGPQEFPLILGGRPGLEKIFGAALPLMEAQDFLVGNLEGSVTRSTEANPRKRFQFRLPPGTAASLKSAGFDLVLLANNHVLDFGEPGFLDTLADIELAGLPAVGAGRTAEAALATHAVPAPGQKSARLVYIGYGSFPAERYGFTTAEAAAGPDKGGINADEEATLRAIREEAARGSTVVVLAHGGREYLFDPAPEIKARYRAFVDAGASLVLGSHPHLLQGVEAWGQGLIAYSLGNFLFTGEKEPEEALSSALVSFLVYRGSVRGFAPTALKVGYLGTDLDSAGGEATTRAFAARCAQLAAPGP